MKKVIIASVLGLLVASSAFAKEVEKHGDKHADKHVTRTVNVEMGDNMRFVPESVDVKKGETIKFVVKNNGSIMHEMVIGSPEELKNHADMMKKTPTMVNHDKNQISLKSKETGEFVWKAEKAGTVEFGCYQPGHFESGMKGKVVVK